MFIPVLTSHNPESEALKRKISVKSYSSTVSYSRLAFQHLCIVNCSETPNKSHLENCLLKSKQLYAVMNMMSLYAREKRKTPKLNFPIKLAGFVFLRSPVNWSASITIDTLWKCSEIIIFLHIWLPGANWNLKIELVVSINWLTYYTDFPVFSTTHYKINKIKMPHSLFFK